MPSTYFVLGIGFVLINAATYFITRKIKEHLNLLYASFTHLFVALLALYYLVDTLILQPNILNQFSIFWFSILAVQLFFYVWFPRSN